MTDENAPGWSRLTGLKISGHFTSVLLKKSGKELFYDTERGLPTWNVQSRGTVALKPFNWNLSNSGRHLPAAVSLQMFPPSRVDSGF
jgi:hypothetical protein